MSLFFRLSLVLLLSAFLLIIFVKGEHECSPLKPLKYKLHGTKTLYNAARKHLNNPQKHRPSPFGSNSLKQEHKRLIKKSCNPVVFFYIQRHAARFPDRLTIENLNEGLLELQTRLKNSDRKCEQNVGHILAWKSNMNEIQDNLITEVGELETRNISLRFKSIFPKFFDAHESDIKFGMTGKLRTAQTASVFLNEISNFNSTNCHFNFLPTKIPTNETYSFDKIINNKCYRKLIKDSRLKMELEHHLICRTLSDEIKGKAHINEQLKSVQKWVAERVSKRLGIDVDIKTLDFMYQACSYELALGIDSVWCTLFDKKELKFLEYIRDYSSYIKGAYGQYVHTKQSCPLIKEVLETFEDVMKIDNVKPKSFFYFSHAGQLKKLFADLKLFYDKHSFSDKTIQKLIATKKYPISREWRSSLVAPFSANVAFILYKCPGNTHRLLTTVNERPVKLKGCKNSRCRVEKFLSSYNDMKDCNLEKICAPKQHRKKQDNQTKKKEDFSNENNSKRTTNGRPKPIVVRDGSTLTIVYPSA